MGGCFHGWATGGRGASWRRGPDLETTGGDETQMAGALTANDPGGDGEEMLDAAGGVGWIGLESPRQEQRWSWSVSPFQNQERVR